MKPANALLCIASLFLLSPGFSQNRTGKGKGRPLTIQGELLPDVSGFDEDGESFPLREKFKGKHVVIVFGCLT